MEIYIDIDLELMKNIGFLWVLVGLVWLLVVLRNGMRDVDDYYYIRERLGIVIFVAVIGWPYNLICWIFSWHIWLMPVSDLFKRK